MKKRQLALNAALATMVAAGLAAKATPALANETKKKHPAAEGHSQGCEGKVAPARADADKDKAGCGSSGCGGKKDKEEAKH